MKIDRRFTKLPRPTQIGLTICHTKSQLLDLLSKKTVSKVFWSQDGIKRTQNKDMREEKIALP